MFPSAPIFQQYNYFRQNLEKKSLSLSIFISFASNFLCKILWDNKNIDANIFIFQIAFSQWRAGLSKKLFWDVFLRQTSFIFMKNFSFNSPALQLFCKKCHIFHHICGENIFLPKYLRFYTSQIFFPDWDQNWAKTRHLLFKTF